MLLYKVKHIICKLNDKGTGRKVVNTGPKVSIKSNFNPYHAVEDYSEVLRGIISALSPGISGIPPHQYSEESRIILEALFHSVTSFRVDRWGSMHRRAPA